MFKALQALRGGIPLRFQVQVRCLSVQLSL
jgi:hypothetical protein